MRLWPRHRCEKVELVLTGDGEEIFAMTLDKLALVTSYGRGLNDEWWAIPGQVAYLDANPLHLELRSRMRS